MMVMMVMVVMMMARNATMRATHGGGVVALTTYS
jgi:hypothetical protein